MADTIRTIRTITFALAVIAIVLCCGGIAWQRDAIFGAFTLNAAQGVLDEAVAVDAPGSVLRIVNVSDRSGAIVVGVPPSSTPLTEVDVTELQDSIWGHYTVAFASGGYAVSHVAIATLAPDGTLDFEASHHVDVRTLVERTGKPAPALHPLYEKSDVFDPATDEPPEFRPGSELK